MGEKDRHDPTEDLRSDYRYRPWPEDRLTKEAREHSHSNIREIPVSDEVLKENAAHLLAHPPKFPLLQGEEESQITARIKDLMKAGEIVWSRRPLATGGDNYVAEYKSVLLEITTMSSPWFELKLSIKGESPVNDWVLENRSSGTPLDELLQFVEDQFDERTKIRRPLSRPEIVDTRVTIWNALQD